MISIVFVSANLGIFCISKSWQFPYKCLAKRCSLQSHLVLGNWPTWRTNSFLCIYFLFI